MSEEAQVTPGVTIVSGPYANTVTSSYIPSSGSWHGVISPTGPSTTFPITTGNVYVNISPADIERIADAVLAKIEQRAHTRTRTHIRTRKG